MDPLLKKVLSRLVFFLIWAYGSAWLFVLVEYTDVDEAAEKRNLIVTLYNTMASKYNMNIEEFKNFTLIAHEALTHPKPQWHYFAAADFVFQAITTIGYGFITPQTPAGQLLCILVCLFGIPIMMMTFAAVGELISRWTCAVITKFDRRVLCRPEPVHVQVKCAVLLSLLTTGLLCFAAWMLALASNFTFLEGVYCWFITFTTIGFGDYVPNSLGKPYQPLSLIKTEDTDNGYSPFSTGYTTLDKAIDLLSSVYYIVGLSLVASVFSAILTAFAGRKCRLSGRGCFSFSNTLDVTNGEGEDSTVQHDCYNTHVQTDNYELSTDNVLAGRVQSDTRQSTVPGESPSAEETCVGGPSLPVTTGLVVKGIAVDS